jgi:hypothetical protein
MNWFEEVFKWVFGEYPKRESELIEIPSTPKIRHQRLTAAQILGPVKHRKIYVFTTTDNGRDHSSCSVCKDPEVTVFSDGVDVLQQNCRMCLSCLWKFGGVEQVELAAGKSKYARRWLDCVRALEKLKKQFPDPMKRPYGDVALASEIKRPHSGYQGIERILNKIANETWTEIDQIAIEQGRLTADAKAKEKYGY